MKRDTRLNVVFLVIFLAVSIPGAVILFRRKLDPSAPRMDQPDEIVDSLPYMAPLREGTDIRWVVPTRTRQWLESVASTETGNTAIMSALPPDSRWEPVISSDHVMQIVGVARAGDHAVVDLLLWDARVPANVSAILTSVNGRPATVVSARRISVPEAIRHELVMMGYIKPPGQVTWVQVRCADLPPNSSCQVKLDDTDPSPPLHTSVQFVVR